MTPSAEIAAATGDQAAARTHLAVVLGGAPWAAGVDVPAVMALAGRVGVEVPGTWRSAAAA